ncbi:MAG: lipoate--protein ligase family protein [Anaerolineae bacterium]|jgi:lipoyl(octanoyl) transferase|nr:lipoate--protein ligase family protein [Anaerolineae bacterium]MBT7071640.1 lipoate--protein ligase family protein [Anaerolineae bacterium]MBT7326507.1 lipoate--protein ligase family protein [Anaerolineae bacterium]
MTKTWRLYLSPPARGVWNMAVDEAILEHVVRGESPPTLRLYSWNPPCLSLGRAQPFSDVNAAALSANGWGIVRRATGGRAILHTDEITYSIIVPDDNPHVSGSLLESYQHLAQGLLAALENLGANVQMNEKKADAGSEQNPVCFETPSAYEITVNRKKLIGSAQARQKDGVLQHGSLPLWGDLARITQALNFPSAESRRSAAEKLLARASTLESALGRAVDWGTASKSFVHGFESALGIQFQRDDLSRSEIVRLADLVKEKYAHPDWTERI